ncbi:SHOCT domain-containing protein [Nocardia sp. NBC_01730]|uniref:SHOCT domain-containing protein n=1 Tax=Nocardia sp. NBC_01730 TaxID=2975998 RepID=UPI003FA3C8AB
MGIGMLLFWGLLIAGVVLLVRLALPADRTPRHPAPPAPEWLLQERFARGEIDEKEFASRLATLRRHVGPQA